MMSSVRDWLESLGLGQYAEVFDENVIEWRTLPRLDHALLREIGVKAVGHRVAMLEAIERLDDSLGAVGVESAGAAPRQLGGHEAERRQLTVMFCDLVGSTELGRRLDAEELHEIGRAFRECCKREIDRYGGFIARYLGDGLLVYFGYPRARENDAESAVLAGLAITRAVPAIGPDLGVELSVRVGVATGPVVVGDLIGEGASREASVVGEAASLASRLEGAASPNAMLVCETTWSLAGARFRGERIGGLDLKGIEVPVTAWHPLATRGSRSRFDSRQVRDRTPHIGRDAELALLRERWQRAREGEGQVVLLAGEPGIGKSRLLAELRRLVESSRPAHVFYQCSPYHDHTALHPFAEQLGRAVGLSPRDDETTRRARLREYLGGLGRREDDLETVLALLLGIESEVDSSAPGLAPEELRSRTEGALIELMGATVAAGPALIEFEDAHWADPTSMDMLQAMAEGMADLPALLVVTHRPELVFTFSEMPHVTPIALRRLGRAQVRALVRAISARRLPREVSEHLVARTDGVPLFVEELTSSMLDGGGADGEIPTTLQASLLARLDQLEEVKTLVQAGAVIGREFTSSVLQAVADVDDSTLAAGLHRLEQSGLVVAGRSHAGERGYLFKHAMFQSVAYDSLLRGRRQTLHARVVDAIEAKDLGPAGPEPGLLARHCREAGLIPRAIEYGRRAGEEAVRRHANVEAVAHFESALALLETLPEGEERDRMELEMRLGLGPAQAQTATVFYADPRVARTFDRAHELAQRVGTAGQQFATQWSRCYVQEIQGDWRSALERVHGLLELSARLPDAGLQMQAHHIAMTATGCMGLLEQTVEHARQVCARYDPVAHRHHRFHYSGHDPYGCALNQLGLYLSLRGEIDEGSASGHEGVEYAEGLAHPESLAHALWLGILRTVACREYTSARALIARAAAHCREHQVATLSRVVSIAELWCDEDRERGLAHLHERLRILAERRRRGVFMPFYYLLLAELALETGRRDVLGFAARHGLEVARAQNERFLEPELLRLSAEHRRGGGDLTLAAENLSRSIAIAAGQGARLFELRASCTLADLERERGRDGAAIRSRIAGIVTTISPGADLEDRRRAEALLAIP